MKSKLKSRLLFILTVVMLLLALGYWYRLTYSMELAQNRGINSTTLPTKLLVATQGSDFKDAVVTNVINFYRKDSVHIKTIDISKLPRMDPKKYDVILILHTWEYGKPPRVVTQFINDNERLNNRMIVYTTSGAGTNRIEGIDAMTGESILENASDVSDEIIEQIEILLN